MLGLRSRAAYLDAKALGAQIANGHPRDALIPIATARSSGSRRLAVSGTPTTDASLPSAVSDR